MVRRLIACLAVSHLVALALTVSAQTIETVAGGGPNDLLAIHANIEAPGAVAFDQSGNLFIAVEIANRVYRVDTSGRVFVVAGTGVSGFSGDGGPATSASLFGPRGVALNAAGDLYIADQLNNRIRRVEAATGLISTVAGAGSTGVFGDGGLATDSRLFSPVSVAIDAAGNLYIVEQGSHRIRRVTAATGIITTVAGNGTPGFAGDGGPATSARLSSPAGIAVNAGGDLYIADQGNRRIRRLEAATGTITTFAGDGTPGFAGDDGPATSASFLTPVGVAVNLAGDLYIADANNRRIRRVDVSTEIITTVAGDGSPGFAGDGGLATDASLDGPMGVALNAAGDLCIADQNNNRIRRVVAGTGIIATLAGNGTTGFAGDDGPANGASLSGPFGVAVDAAGNLYIADRGNSRIRRVEAATGVISTVAGNGFFGFAGDGGPATSASFSGISGVVANAAGDLYVADSNSNRIRRIAAATGIITTVAGNGAFGFAGDGGPAISASLFGPQGVALNAAGDLFIADTNNSRIRRVEAATGIISTVAGNGAFVFAGDGGLATSASLSGPTSVALNVAGDLYIADQASSRIRRIAAATGIITTVAGNGAFGFAGDGGPATSASLRGPVGVALNTAGDLFVVDSSNRVRRVASPCQNITCSASDTPCGIASCDPNGPAGNCNVLTPKSAATVCRSAANVCDAAEACDGVNTGACPIDAFAPAGQACGDVSSSTCDAADTCDGSGACLANLAPITTLCRSSAGICDIAEQCDGAGACPADTFVPSATLCRLSSGECDVAEQCSGTDAICPADGFVTAGTECRAVTGACDLAEQCSGTSGTCPADGFATAGTECRGSVGACDLPEQCSGTVGSCPIDGFASAGTQCRGAAGDCDVAEQCDGTSTECPVDVLAGFGTACGDTTNNGCTAPDICNGSGTCDARHQDCGVLADAALCPFDVQPQKGLCIDSTTNVSSGEVCDPGNPTCLTPGTDCRPTSQFAIAFAQDPGDSSAWQLEGTTPGGFSYNSFYTGPFPAVLEISVPYPFITLGSNAVRVYDGNQVTTPGGCFQPMSPVAESSVQISLGDWINGAANNSAVVCDAVCGPSGGEPAAGTCRFQLPVEDPGSGIVYLQVALSYGLVGPLIDANPCDDGLVDRYAPGAFDVRFGEPDFDALIHGTSEMGIRNGTNYVFSHDDGIATRYDWIQGLTRVPEPELLYSLVPGIVMLAGIGRRKAPGGGEYRRGIDGGSRG